VGPTPMCEAPLSFRHNSHLYEPVAFCAVTGADFFSWNMDDAFRFLWLKVHKAPSPHVSPGSLVLGKPRRLLRSRRTRSRSFPLVTMLKKPSRSVSFWSVFWPEISRNLLPLPSRPSTRNGSLPLFLEEGRGNDFRFCNSISALVVGFFSRDHSLIGPSFSFLLSFTRDCREGQFPSSLFL